MSLRTAVLARLMIWLLLGAAALASADGRRYHQVTIEQLPTTRWTHVEVTGLVVYVRKQQDGDWHVTIVDAAGRKAVLEIIPLIPMSPPKKGQRIRARGISRVDRHHKWGEVHPLEHWELERE